ncbi:MULTISPECIES: helix-turn-helix transcriptional regulator [Weeksella]|uniref:helix-turn-helix domain-containing protein n=1 Tax=Weeksella TaxID=1013 RepID=UPI0008A3F005|nr:MULTISPECIES: helix-turn-helix transcriptional regulator [Weeksella]MDK7375485.1 helix-turn-helix transcriptional regulator [Weeksella virosa]OFM84540.1 hypothetical protein HMPREF2660_08500 [Weeksella sp. HMSC059D05]
MTTFSKKLNSFIFLNGFETKKEFAEFMGIDQQTIRNVTNGREPSYRFIKQLLAKFPEIDLNYLIKDEFTALNTPDMFDDMFEKKAVFFQTRSDKTKLEEKTEFYGNNADTFNKILEKLENIEDLSKDILDKVSD